MNFLTEWFFFTFSDKAKFSIKVALSITFTYLFILATGLEYASVAVITIILIASPEGVKDALSKGLLRIGGTILGAVVGMSLIAFFPQDQLYYLISLSLFVTFVLYLRNAYRGDNTLFMLAAMTAMAVFDGGEVEGVFMYGVDRTLITILSIVFYTLIFLFLWPKHPEKNDSEYEDNHPSFIWFDIEHIKGAIQAFVVFWMATAIWYFLNPPGGFMLVMLATGFSALTSFSPIKPSVMAILINVSLLIAILVYIFVLPNLSHWLELSLVLFIYTFFAFYFFPPALSIIILIGLNTLMITNTMSYHVDLFLGIVILMDMVFALLIILSYFPFSRKPEHLYRVLIKRFAYLNVLRLHNSSLLAWYANTHLTITLEKLKWWGSNIDHSYFHLVDQKQIEALHQTFHELSKELSHSLLSGSERQKLIAVFRSWHTYIDVPSAKTTESYFSFYPPLRIRLLECQKSIEAIDWTHLRQGRF